MRLQLRCTLVACSVQSPNMLIMAAMYALCSEGTMTRRRVFQIVPSAAAQPAGVLGRQPPFNRKKRSDVTTSGCMLKRFISLGLQHDIRLLQLLQLHGPVITGTAVAGRRLQVYYDWYYCKPFSPGIMPLPMTNSRISDNSPLE